MWLIETVHTASREYRHGGNIDQATRPVRFPQGEGSQNLRNFRVRHWPSRLREIGYLVSVTALTLMAYANSKPKSLLTNRAY